MKWYIDYLINWITLNIDWYIILWLSFKMIASRDAGTCNIHTSVEVEILKFKKFFLFVYGTCKFIYI